MRPWTDEADAEFPLARPGLQWGHGLAAVDGSGRAGRRRRMSLLQWGHGLAAVDGRPSVARRARRNTLQWGHGLAAVDGRRRRRRGKAGGRASMGPRPCGRGRLPSLADRADAERLQWGHGLAAVDGAACCLDFFLTHCFNGATALRPWTGRAGGRGRWRLPASMGPRPCGRGRRAPIQWGARLFSCFNGATALRPWTA